VIMTILVKAPVREPAPKSAVKDASPTTDPRDNWPDLKVETIPATLLTAAYVAVPLVGIALTGVS